MLLHFAGSEIFRKTDGFRVISKNLKKSQKVSWFLGPQKFNTRQKSSQTHITLIWDA